MDEHKNRSEHSTNLSIRDDSVNRNDDNNVSDAMRSFVLGDMPKSEIIDKICMICAEVIGTGLLVFFGCMGCIDWIQMPGNN